MTKIHLASIAVAAVMSATTMAAQTPSPAAESAQSSAGAADRVTVTGCVERADQVSPAGSAVGTTVDSLDFVLMKAPDPAAPSAASAATTANPPTATGTSGTAAVPLYRLQADIDKLNPHVGQKVEIVGTRDTAAGASAPQSPAAANPNASGANASGVNAPRLHVDSVKMLAESCGR